MEKKRLQFVKMEGCGNDYIYFDCFTQEVERPERLAIKASDRHFGIGGDGIVLILPSDIADARMRIFNRDGSEGEMCGNAIRCVGKYLRETGYVSGKTVRVETGCGIRELRLLFSGGAVDRVRADMGAAVYTPEAIPVDLPGDSVIGREVILAGEPRSITCVSMGNPHCVLFADDLSDDLVHRVGPEIEHSPLFPRKTNVEFVRVVDSHHLQMRVWERGSGETMACGTGACAAVAAAVSNGLCPKGVVIRVELPGGTLEIEYEDHTGERKIYMTGPARVAFTGVYMV